MNSTDLRQQLTQLQNAEANLIINHIDEETGEIPENIFTTLENIGHSRGIIINSAIESYNEFSDLLSYIDSKLKRLQALKKTYSTTTTSIKSILQRSLSEGIKINSDNYQVSWRKSESVIVNDFVNLNKIEQDYPDAVKTVKNLNKTVLKKHLKEGVEIDGVELQTKNNIQIK